MKRILTPRPDRHRDVRGLRDRAGAGLARRNARTRRTSRHARRVDRHVMARQRRRRFRRHAARPLELVVRAGPAAERAIRIRRGPAWRPARVSRAARAPRQPARQPSCTERSTPTLLKEPLARYAVELPGSFAFDDVDVTHRYGSRLPMVRGDLKWTGGTVNYRLSGRDQRLELPPLVGFFDSSSGQPTLTVIEDRRHNAAADWPFDRRRRGKHRDYQAVHKNVGRTVARQ